MLGTDEAFTVDLNDQSSVEFIIQLRDDDGNDLEMEGVEIEIEVESTDILVQAAEVDSSPDNAPIPDYRRSSEGADDSSTATVLTDRDGEAIFELEAPRRYDRLDEVLIKPDCDCDSETISVAWSAGRLCSGGGDTCV